MDLVELFQRLGLALAIGVLVGIERGWREREAAEGTHAAGLRTLALSGLLGGVLAALVPPAAGPMPLALGFVVYGAIFAAFRWREVAHDETYGATTVVAGLLTFALGAYAVLGDMVAAAAAAVVTALLLALKSALHGWLKQITWEELRAGLLLAAMTFLALPVLPDRGMGPWNALNPHEIWLLTVLIAGVSFIGYVAVKLAGQERGLLIGGAVGGLVASTAVTLSFARLARAHPANSRTIIAGAVMSGGCMMCRVLVVILLLNVDLLPRLAPPLLGGAAGSVVAALVMAGWMAPRRAEPVARLDLKNPFDFWTAVRFGALLAVVFLLARGAQESVGDAGLLALAAASGIADVDAITLSMARLASSGLAPSIAASAILVAVAVNTLVKIPLGWIAGGRSAGLLLAAGVVSAGAGAALGFMAMRLV